MFTVFSGFASVCQSRVISGPTTSLGRSFVETGLARPLGPTTSLGHKLPEDTKKETKVNYERTIEQVTQLMSL